MQSGVLITALMLRGPQTAGELRINSERLHKFADISSVESFLKELAERAAGNLVMELPRQPGARENRWVHLLSGIPDAKEYKPATSAASYSDEVMPASELAILKADVVRLEVEVSALRKIVDSLCTQLGI